MTTLLSVAPWKAEPEVVVLNLATANSSWGFDEEHVFNVRNFRDLTPPRLGLDQRMKMQSRRLELTPG
jgi:hypothetical protein